MKPVVLRITFLAIFAFAFLATNAQARKQIQIIYSETLEVTEEYGPDVNILIGKVELRHEGATMFCDTAYYNSAENFFNAIGNIHIIKPNEKDTVNLYGDTLYYEGAIKMAMVRNNVVMTQDSLTLYTNFMDYDVSNSVGYYYNGGRTLNGQDTLISRKGYYYTKENLLVFRDTVEVYNPDFNIFSDTLKHHTKTETSFFLGPTDIVSDSNYIYCENGWYNHKTDIAQFNQNAYLESAEHRLKGDSLYYERNTGFGLAIENVQLIDTLQNMELWGNWGEFYEKTENAFMTDSAQFIQYNEKNDSLFLHADTLRMNNDTVFLADSDSTLIYREVKGHKNVKMFRSDFQLKCDSIIYSFRDSVIRMFRDPVLWSDNQQLSGDTIIMFTQNNELKQIHIKNNSFVVSQEDTTRYNQIKGLNLIAYIENKKLVKVDVSQNSESLYYAKDGEELVGANKARSTNMAIYFEDSKVDRIWFYEKPDATFYPPNWLKGDEKILDGFKWLEAMRPKNRYEIFD